ncbi:hypothetical protein ScPMuIL_017826 [Solemya velum]
MATWVQELFPPAFGLTIDDVLKRREHLAEEEQNNSKHDQELRQTLNKKGNEEVGKREIAPLASQKNDSKVELVDTAKLDDESLWKISELNTLREFFTEIKKQNTQLKVRVNELDKHNKLHKADLKTKEAVIQKQNMELTENRIVTMRLKKHCESLQAELKNTSSKLRELENMNCELRAEKQALVKTMCEIDQKANSNRIEKNRMQLQLQTLSKKALSEKIMAEEQVTAQYQKEILDLQKTIQHLTESLQDERRIHGVTKKGLDHLRQHFASLPLNDIMPQNNQ